MARILSHVLEVLQSSESQTLKRVDRGARFVRAAAEHLGSGSFHLLADPVKLLVTFDGARAGNVNRRIISTDLDPVDFHDNVPVDVASAHQPIGNLDRDDLLDAGQRLQETQIDFFRLR